MSEAWDVKEGGVNTKIITPGRYECICAEVTAILVPGFKDKTIKEQKILFKFLPTKIKCEAGEEAAITYFVTPNSGKASNMYKLLCDMSDDGTMSEEVRLDRKFYQAYAEDFMGKKFLVTCITSNSGKYNIGTAITPLSAITGKEEDKKKE